MRGRGSFFVAIVLSVTIVVAGLSLASGAKLSGSTKVGFDPFDVAAGDFNRDGRTDLAVANFASSSDPASKTSITILAGKKGGGYKAVKTLPSAQPDGIEVARVGSGKEPDLVVSAFTGEVEVYKGGKGFKFSGPRSTAVGGTPRDLVADDFNHDARTDVAVTRDTDDVRVLYGTKGSKGFGNPQSFAGASDGGSIVLSRLNRGTLPDLVATNRTTGKITVMLGKKHGGFKTKSYKVPNATSVAIDDFDQDGNKDVAVVSGNPAIRGSRAGGNSKPAITVFKGSASGKLKKDRKFRPKGVPSSFGYQLIAARLGKDPDPSLVLAGSTSGSDRSARRAGDKGYVMVLKGGHGTAFEAGKQLKVSGNPFKFGLIARSKGDQVAIPLLSQTSRGSVRILSGK
ncbi:hypothetical protein BH10ACT11_BH10ACT11_11670 [soil metagenome]